MSLAGLLSGISNVISRQGLHYRFNKNAATFMQKCLLYLMAHLPKGAALEGGILSNFDRVMIFDSSSWDISPKLRHIFPGSGGAASEANCKVQFCYEYKHATLHPCAVSPGNNNDQSYGKIVPKALQKGDLTIFDQGFFSMQALNETNDIGAFFLTRFLSSVQLYQSAESEQAVDLVKLLKYSTENFLAITAFAGQEKKTRLKVRLICLRAPTEIANLRRMRLKKAAQKKGRACSRKALLLCSWTLLVTNAPESLLPSAAAYSLYRIRWQIELVFKQLKSVLGIQKCKSANPYRLLCQLYGSLITAFLFQQFFSVNARYLWRTKTIELSFDKFYKRCQERAHYWLHILRVTPRKAFNLICSGINSFLPSTEKYHQKNRPSSLQSLLSIEKSHSKKFNLVNLT